MNVRAYTISGTSKASSGTTVIGSPVMGLRRFRRFKGVAELVGATGDVLDVYVQWTPDGGTTWFDYAHFTQLAAGGAAAKWSFGSDFGGTGITAVGKGTSPALAANAIVGGMFGDGLRVIGVAGASTTVGAAVAVTFYVEDDI